MIIPFRKIEKRPAKEWLILYHAEGRFELYTGTKDEAHDHVSEFRNSVHLLEAGYSLVEFNIPIYHPDIEL